jgi:hypothetical protein
MQPRTITSVRRHPEPLVSSRRVMRLRAEVTAFALALLSALGLNDQVLVRSLTRQPKARAGGRSAMHETLSQSAPAPSDACF